MWTTLEFSKNDDGVVAIHLPEQVGQVTHGPVRVPAGDPLQDGFQGTFAVLHGVRVRDPGGGEGAVGGQVLGILYSLSVRIQQDHQVFQDIQIVQHGL